MLDWNVVVTVFENRYAAARDFLNRYGPVAKTDFYNVLVMRVIDVPAFMELFGRDMATHPANRENIARVMPVTTTFAFDDPVQFESRATEVIEPWIPRLAGSRFHVRMHRRGFKGRLSSQYEEQFLDHRIQQRLTESHARAEIDFQDPDYVIALETVGQRAGLSLWTRDDFARFPFLRLD